MNKIDMSLSKNLNRKSKVMPTAFINMMTFMALTIIPMHLKLSVGACVARPAWNVNI